MKQATALIILLALILPMAGCLSGAGNSSEYTSLPDDGLNASGMASGGTGVIMAVRADEIPTSSPEAKEWFIRGLDYNAHYNQFEEALACFNNSLELDPVFGEAWCAKGVALHNLKRYDEALDCSILRTQQQSGPSKEQPVMTWTCLKMQQNATGKQPSLIPGTGWIRITILQSPLAGC